MDNDDELKDLFGKKHLENDFPFDKDNWEKLAAELKEERKNKRRLFYYFMAIGLFIGLSGIYVLMNTNNQNVELSFNSKKEKPSLPQTKSEINTVKKGSQASLKNLNTTKPLSEKVKIKSETPVRNPEEKTKLKPEEPIQNRDEKTKTDLSFTKKTKTEKTQFNSEHVNPNGVGAVEIKKVSSSDKKKPQDTESIKETKSADRPEIARNNLPPVLTKKNRDSEESKPANLPDAKQNNSEPGQTKKEDKSAAEIKSETPPNVRQNNPEVIITKQVHSIPEKTLTDTLIPKTIEPSTETKVDEVLAKTEPSVSVPKADSTLGVPSVSKDSLAKKSDNTFSFDVGSDYLFGWKNTGKTEANGFNPLIGLTYYNAITSKIIVSIGVQYTSVNNLNNTSHTSSNTKLKFGEESDVTKISATKMHYLIVPLKLNYCINNNNYIGIGYNLGILFDVKSKVETYTERFDSQSNYQVSTAMGYRSGFNNFDGQLALSYRRRIYKELFISSELFYGLRDIKDNAIYKSAVFERNCGLKLMLSYNFLKK